MTTEFELGGIANEFRNLFTKMLSDRAEKKGWKAKVNVQTNEKQNMFLFSFSSLNSFIVEEDIKKVMQEMQNFFKFEEIRNTNFSIEVINIQSK